MNSLTLWLRAEWDRIVGTALLVAGGISLVLTYQAVANDRFVAEQMADLASGGLGGLFLVAVGIMLRLQADLHDEWRKLDRIEAALQGTSLPDPAGLMAGARHGSTVQREPRPELQPAFAVDAGSPRRRLPALLAGGGLVVAALIVGLGYDRAAGTGDVADATGGLGIGVAGLLVASAVVGMTQLVGRSRLAARKGRLLAPFLRPAPAAVPAVAGMTGFVLVAPGLTRFHLDGCPTLARTETERLPRQDVSGGLSPCRICGAS